MKKLVAIAALVFTVSAFGDSYLYWMVNDTSTGIVDGYNQARVGVMNNTTGLNAGYLNLYDESATSLNTTIGFTDPGDSSAYYANLGSFGSGYSFYVELLNDGTFVGRSSDSEILSYSEAVAMATHFGVSTPQTSTWTTTSFTSAPIPEPTSGMMILIGCALLGLKRKRV